MILNRVFIILDIELSWAAQLKSLPVDKLLIFVFLDPKDVKVVELTELS